MAPFIAAFRFGFVTVGSQIAGAVWARASTLAYKSCDYGGRPDSRGAAASPRIMIAPTQTLIYWL